MSLNKNKDSIDFGKLREKTSKITLLQLFIHFLNLLRSSIVYQHVGEEGFGVIAIITAYQSLSLFLSFPGTQLVVPRKLIIMGNDERSYIISFHFIWILISSCSYLLLLWNYIIIDNSEGSQVIKEFIKFVIPLLLLSNLLNLFRLVLNSLNRQVTVVKVELVSKFVDVLVSVLLVKNYGITALLIALLCSFIIGFISYTKISLNLFSIKYTKNKVNLFIELLKESKKFALLNFLLYGSNFIGIYLLADLTNSSIVGVYAIAKLLILPITFVTNAFLSLLIPNYSLLNKEKNNLQLTAKKIITFFANRAPIVFLTLFFVMPLFFKILYQDVDSKVFSVSLIMILIALNAFHEFNLNSVAIVERADDYLIKAQIIAKTVYIISSFILIQNFGVHGLVYTELGSSMIYLTIMFLKYPFIKKELVKVYLLIIELVLLTYGLTYIISNPLLSIIGGLISSIAYLLLDRNFLINLIRKNNHLN
ncbi:MAG: hypothetical protein HeimC2_17930 [Candidatus Heimdallarchaeota archaeon LC_2]|nr:MAG: hypothetical protein HeimC2_17930 [Candidatus Heimdallarchaeota archaeon LC_2]